MTLYRQLPSLEEIEDFETSRVRAFLLAAFEEFAEDARSALETAETERDVFQAQGALKAYRRAILELKGLKGLRLARDAARTKERNEA